MCGDFAGVLNSEELQKLLCLDSPDLWLSWDLEAISTRVSAVLDSAKERDWWVTANSSWLLET